MPVAPNTRMQRTRSSPSAPRSPLMRRPLGSRGAREQRGERGLVLAEFQPGEIIGDCRSGASKMSERGASLGPVNVPVAPWHKVRAWLFGERGGLSALAVRQPNRRVQRTRSSPSAHRSPLTRYPSGGHGLAVSAFALLMLARLASAAEPSAEEVVQRLRQVVPSVAPAGEILTEQLVGRFTAQTAQVEHRSGPFLAGSDLYLCSGGRYLYVRWADIEPETIYDRGRWSFSDGVVDLSSDHVLNQSDYPRDRRYVAFRFALDKAPDLRLIGTDQSLAYFSTNAGEDPGFMLLITSLEQKDRYSATRSESVYKKLMRQAWRPDYFHK